MHYSPHSPTIITIVLITAMWSTTTTIYQVFMEGKVGDDLHTSTSFLPMTVLLS